MIINMKRMLTVILLLVVMTTCAQAEVIFGYPPDGWTQDVLRVTAIPVAEGDALLLECAGESMMVDGGPQSRFHHVTDMLAKRGITHFKYLLSTHSHDDHIYGLYHLMDRGYTADEYLHPYSEIMVDSLVRVQRTIDVANRRGIPVRRLYTGDELTLGGATVTVMRHWHSSNDNARSMIEHVQFGESTIWLCADITSLTQIALLDEIPQEMLKADIMKAPHHGISAVQASFLEAVEPQFVVVTNHESDAPNIKYQMNARGIPALYCADGAVVMETDGHDWYVWQEK